MEAYFLYHEPCDCLCMPRGDFKLLIGRSPCADIIVCDEHISGKHIFISLQRDNSILIDVCGRNGAEVNGEFLDCGEKAFFLPGVRVKIGSLWICIGIYHCFIGKKAVYRSGLRRINPYMITPRIIPESERRSGFVPSLRNAPVYDLEPIELDPPPPRKTPDKQPLLLAAGPALTMAVPILLGSGRKIMIIAGVISAIWAASNVLSRQKKRKQEELRRRRTYSEYVSECDRCLNDRMREIKNTMIFAYPDVSEYLKANGNIHLVWNRKESEKDFLYLRCGIGEIDFPVEIKYQREKFSVTEDSLKAFPSELKKKYSSMKGVPVCIDLALERLYAISTEQVKKTWEMAFFLALGIAVSIMNSAVKIAFFTGNRIGLFPFSFIPHCWIGTHSLISDGRDENEVISAVKAYEGCVVIFTDRVDIFNLFSTREDFKIFFLTEDFDRIPLSAGQVLYSSASFSGIIKYSENLQNRIPVSFDRLSLKKTEIYSRITGSLSSHVYEVRKPIPDKVLLTDLIRFSDYFSFEELPVENTGTASGGFEISEDMILRLWNTPSPDDSLKVPIGMGDDERITFLDVDEKSSGPHGLIAGTTGSGKSELLQTIILSLAIRFSPKDVTFFLIDYKGGGMANMFSSLPHLAGSISNLSGSTIERAMVSIKSEIRYRQEEFAKIGVNSIRDYRKHAKMPHILIIIDEFAELKKEEPEFMAQLVSVAQVGRSLGVHLILSTQKPAGCVDDKIWSNARFRICLKVRDKMDSNDMLHRPDAAMITNVGRAYLQVGNDEIFEEFQCGYTSAPISVRSSDTGIRIYDGNLRLLREEERPPGRLTEVGPGPSKEAGTGPESVIYEPTQIDVMKDLVNKAFLKGGFEQVRKLWLPELTGLVFPPKDSGDGDSLSVGIYDDPYSRIEGEYLTDPRKNGNIAVIGAPGSGKSTVLLRLLTELVNKFDTKEIQFYILDFGGKKLEVFRQCRMCGGYVGVDECERVPKLLGFIDEQIKLRRKNKRNDGPHIITVIDNFAGMLEYADSDHEMAVIDMLKNGRSQKITFIVSAGNIGSGELPGRAMAQIDETVPLSLKDKYLYAAALNTQASQIPAVDMVPGRGVVRVGKRTLAFQAYTPVADDEHEWENKITEIIFRRNKEFSTDASSYPYIPQNPTLKDLKALIREQPEHQGHTTLQIYQNSKGDYGSPGTEKPGIKNTETAMRLPIGYIERTGKIYSLPFDEFAILLIGGRRGSGRKNTLNIISLVADDMGIATYRLNHIEDLLIINQQNNNTVIALSDDLGGAVSEFYSQHYDPDLEDKLLVILDDANRMQGRSLIKLCGVISAKDRALLMGRKLWGALCEHPYGLCMGGMLDEFNIFDFSYMGYTAMQKRRKAGFGSVALYEEEMFYGNVVIPLCEKRKTEKEQTEKEQTEKEQTNEIC